MKVINLEFWADSFHEGFWACQELARFFELKNLRYEKGFIPVFLFKINTRLDLEITVLGSYKNWDPIPDEISYLIDWGKPDLIAYDPKNKKIIFAMEETAAVPTGNQALQRCERMYGSLRSKIPFWYLLGEYGMHVDGGIRRDSIWPTILGIKLSCILRTPCMVLHYADATHPEDYTFGKGVESLYRALACEIEIYLGIKSKNEIVPILTEQYQHMLDFVDSQWQRVVNYIPEKELLDDPGTAQKIAMLVGSNKILDNTMLDFFNWKNTDSLPSKIYKNIIPGGLIKYDPFILEVEKIIASKKGYNLSSNAGSRPQSGEDIRGWIDQQKYLFQENKLTDAKFDLKLADFPKSKSGRYHITTAKNVLFLIDSWQYIEDALKSSFGRLRNFTLRIEGNTPVLLYISNSLKPGRIFGDPFTGQLSAFSNIFSKNVGGDKTRLAVAYYPHQVHTQLFDEKMNFKKNKGIVMMRELLDYAIFHGGVVVNLTNGKIL